MKVKITFRGKELKATCCDKLASDGGMLYKDSTYFYSVDESTMEVNFAMKRPDPNGGAGRGQGRKKKFEEPAKVLYCRVPQSKYEECLAAIEKIIKA